MIDDAKIKLKIVLGYFVHQELISDEVIHLTFQYLFEEQFIPMFVDNELYQTVFYLKEIVGYFKLKNIDDLITYFENKRLKMREFLTDLIKNKKKI